MPICTTGAGAAIASPNPPLTTGLLAWYRNNGTDWSGNNKTLQIVGTVNTAVGLNGASGAAMLIDGVSSPQSAFFYNLGSILSGPPYSMAAWVRPDSITWTDDFVTYVIASQALGGTGKLSLQLTSTDPGSGFEQFIVANNDDVVSPSLGLTGQDFVHFCVTDDGDNLVKLYCNGVQVYSGTNVQSGIADTSFAVAFVNFAGVIMRQQFTGIWDRALTAGNVASLYNNGNGSDPTA